MICDFLQKPKLLVWAFLFFLITSASHAGFYEEHVQPVKERAWDASSQRILVAGLASTWLASKQDNEVRSQYQNHQTMSAETADLGDRFGTYLVGPAIALGQIYFDRDNGLSHMRGLVYTTAVTHLLKETVRRERPDSSNHQSMASGHSSTAFATATSLTYAYGVKAAVIAYPVATFVALSRMSDDVHWFSDVVAGAFIGVWMGRASYYSTESIYKQNNSTFTPVVSSRKVGLSWETSF